MKRSQTATLLLMGLAPLYLTACDDGAQTQQQNFTSVADCVKAGVPEPSCQTAWANAEASVWKTNPHFTTHDACVAQYGADQCQEHTDNNGNSFWGPVMTGFLISRMLGSGSSYVYYPAGAVYRQTSGSFYSPSIGVYGGSYASSGSGWRTSSASGAGDGFGGSRAITSSRGGFGSASAAAGGWGG